MLGLQTEIYSESLLSPHKGPIESFFNFFNSPLGLLLNYSGHTVSKHVPYEEEPC